MRCGRRAVQHPRIPRAVADLLRACHDRRDALTRRHTTDLVAACSGPRHSAKGQHTADLVAACPGPDYSVMDWPLQA